MLGLFRKKSKEQKLQKDYDKLMQEWYRLSSINRAKSDAKYLEAQGIADQIFELKNDDL